MRVKKTVVTEPGEQPGEQPDLIGAGQGDPREKEDLNTELDCRLWLPPLQKRLPSLALFFFKFIYLFLATPWRIPWTEEPGGLQSTGLQRVGHD